MSYVVIYVRYLFLHTIVIDVTSTSVRPVLENISWMKLKNTKEHRVLPIKQRSTPNYPKCSKHTRKLCELHCDECNIPICSRCVSSKKHHNLVDILTLLESKKKLLRKDLEELENNIYPIYQEIASEITDQKSEMNKNSERLRSFLDKREKEWHNKIDAMINEMKLEIYRTHSEIETALNKQEEEIKHSITEMTKSIVELKRVLDSSDACLVSEYKSRNCEFKKLPRKLVFFFPTLLTNKTELRETFGTLSASSITTQERFHTIVSPDISNSPSSRQLLDEPVILTTIDTGIGYLYSVVYLDDDKILTTDKYLKIFNCHGELLQSIQPKSGGRPSDIAVTRDGEIVYTDRSDDTVNVVKDTQIQTVVKLQGWQPFNLCCTSSGDLLVVMVCDEYIKTKIVRYSGSTETQSIQFNDEGQPLFSSSVNTLYICENRNFDICVAHYDGGAVVVVNQSGKLRFTYTALNYHEFRPVGITTDSQGRILTTDTTLIHILDQDGQFLRYIDNCKLWGACGLSIDSRDNLFVIRHLHSSLVEKIQYYT